MMIRLRNSQKPVEFLLQPEGGQRRVWGARRFRVRKPNLTQAAKIKGVEKMKNHSSVFRMALAAVTATAIYFGTPGSIASAQNTSTTNASGVQAPALAHGVGEVVKMYQSGINKDILVNYVNNTALPYHLNADGIIYLQHLGVPQEVTKAMILRDGQLQQQAQAYQQQQAAGAVAYNQAGVANAAPPVVMPSTPAPAVYPYAAAAPSPVYPDYSAYPDYGYGYPYYGSGLVIGGGYGWGWGGYGWRWGGYGWGGRGGYGWGGRGGYGWGGRGGYGWGGRGGYGGGGRGGFGGGGGGHGGGGGGHR
jgi:hypothetical protein